MFSNVSSTTPSTLVMQDHINKVIVTVPQSILPTPHISFVKRSCFYFLNGLRSTMLVFGHEKRQPMGIDNCNSR